MPQKTSVSWFAIIFALTCSAFSQTPQPPQLRTGTNVTPIRYRLELRLTPSEAPFSGLVEVDVRIQEPTSVIWLNSNKLIVDKAHHAKNASSSTEAKILAGGDNFVGLEFPAPLPAGKATLKLAFHGEVDTKNSDGLFRGKDGGESYLYTQFEPIAARRAFPCFDEPAFKVPWQLTLDVPEQHLAVANTPVVSESRPAAGRKRIVFGETKPLPSYLLAFAVGPFEVADAGTAGRKKTRIRIIVPKGRLAEAKYAVQVTPSILEKLEQYFDIPYPYEKLDQIAVPLFGGAMENAGLITYADSIMLSKAEQDTTRRRRGFFSVCVHEIAHQWFGNLVTMAWWNDLWLNESFATWMENKLTAEMNPEWKAESSNMRERLSAMRADTLATARKMRQPAESNHDIANAFDGITYSKGGAVLSMLESWVTKEKFRAGVTRYLNKHAWQNARAEDFLAAVSEVAGKDFAPAANTFVDQPGVPEIAVRLDCAEATPTVFLTQQRFLPAGSKANAAAQSWDIPVCVEWDENGKPVRECTVLRERESALKLTKAHGCPQWISGNAGMAGYYRVNYQGDLLSRLIEKGFQNQTAAAKMGILGDVNAFASRGSISAGDALKLTSLVKDSPDRDTLTAGLELALSVGSLAMRDQELRPRFQHFIQTTFAERARALGWKHRPGDDEDTRLLRSAFVASVAVAGNDPELMKAAREPFDEWLKDRTSVPQDMVGGLVRAAVKDGDKALFDRVLEEAKKAKTPKDRGPLLGALASFSDPELSRASKELAVAGTFDFRESLGLLFSDGGNPANVRQPFEFIRDNFDRIAKLIPNSIAGSTGAYLPLAASGFCSASGAEEVKTFFGERIKQFTGGPRMLAQTVETIEVCEARSRIVKPQLQQFLATY